MKYLKLFESYKTEIDDILINHNDKLIKLNSERDTSILSIVNDYKQSIEDCLYYLSDNFQCVKSFNAREAIKYEEIPDYTIKLEFDKDRLSEFIEECGSSLERLNNLKVNYKIDIWYRKGNDDQNNIPYIERNSHKKGGDNTVTGILNTITTGLKGKDYDMISVLILIQYDDY